MLKISEVSGWGAVTDVWTGLVVLALLLMVLVVWLININKGYNDDLKKSCRDLYGYMVYVDKVREFARDYPLEKAVEMAISYCIQHDILAEFLTTPCGGNEYEYFRV